MRKSIYILSVASLFIPLIIGNTFCSQGGEPDTVIVPIGKTGNGDPYDTSGDACGDSSTTSAYSVGNYEGEKLIQVIFFGTKNRWSVLLTASEFQLLEASITEDWGADYMESITSEKIDSLHKDLCAAPEDQTGEEKTLYGIFQEVLGERMNELAQTVCS